MIADRASLDRELDRLAAMLTPWLTQLRHPAQFWPQFDALAHEILGHAQAKDRVHVEDRLLKMLNEHRELLRRCRDARPGGQRPLH
ncbi:hypothetical protein MNQ95_01885 [Pseudoxanthomonas daejeonensis]|uniref:hypothetical protein n=1 Tax=Pseudoxanthomonas daejeonensis TaxID=266062 RepID=UPI001F542173|nr:hypothetical protein [Pseudoxanthomonas daejeonensis]UNK57886.1 hypothetical protein MNQ95_01885 [Pseudoxanthomonas daejeonensis]